MKIYLVRHAESVGNLKGSLISTTDFGLTEKGKKQSQRLGEFLNEELKAKKLITYCSPLLRAKQTLQEMLSCIDACDVTVTEIPELKEMDLGILEGMPFDEQVIRYPDINIGNGLSHFSAPGGECYRDIKRRIEQFYNTHIDGSDDENIVIVSHGITLRVLVNTILQRPDEDVNCLNWFENTAQTVITYDKEKGRFDLDKLNDYSHLKELVTANYKDWGFFAAKDAYLKRIAGE